MTRTCLRLATTCAAILLLLAAARATIVVDPGGGGDFTTIEAAIAAAADGEQILVKAGTYVPATGQHLVIDGKGLSIVAEAGASVVLPGLQVVGLPAGHWVIARGLTIDDSLMADASPVGAVHVTGPQGAVWLEDCTISGHKAFVPSFLITFEAASPALAVEAGGSVTLQRCTLQGGDGVDKGSFLSDKWFAGIGAPGLLVKDARVALLDSTVTGGHGGNGDDLFSQPPFGANGGPALRVEGAGFAHVAGSELTGGDTGLNTFTDYDMPGSGLVVVSALGQVWLRDSVVQTGEIIGVGEPGLPIEGSPASFTYLTAPARSLEVTSPLREGQLGTLTVQGQAGDVAVLLVALGVDSTPLSGKQGVFGLDPSVLLLPITLGTITDPSGVLAVPFVTPSLNPVLLGLTVPMQLATVASGEVTLDGGTALAWLDASL